jgi:hypothetical protein
MKKLFLASTAVLGLTIAPELTKAQGQLSLNPCITPPVSCPTDTCQSSGCVFAMGGTTPYTYLWNPGGQTTQTVSGLCPGQYTVTVTDAVNATASTTVTISTPSILTVTCSANPASIPAGNSSTLTATAFNGTPPFTYYWSQSFTINPIVVSPTTTTCYSVTVTDANGCTDTASICVTVTPTGINEYVNNISLTISPNPFCSQTVLRTDNLLNNATLTVDNCFGQTVKQIKNINGQTVVFSRDNLASGLYFVRLTEENPAFGGAGKTIAVDKLVITDK